ncbi:hypothetical protein ACSBR2_026232 [Camellia fascicularis]
MSWWCQFVRCIEELKKSTEEKAYAVKNAEDGAADLKKRLEQLDKSLEQYEKDYQGVLSGKSSGSEEKCLEDQLGDAKVAVGSAETELKQLKTKISHSEKELKEKAHQLLSKREEAVAIENELNARTKDVENVKLALESLLYEDRQMEALQKDRAIELELVQKLKDEIRILSTQLAHVDFTYHDPMKNFDSTRVKGVVAKLIKVKDGSTMTALEKILETNFFKMAISEEDLHFQVGKGNAEVALSLSAMAYVFGSTFVCKTIDATREVAFNRKIGTPSVTLEGDIFQPCGLLTGGSCKGGGDLLRQLDALAEAESKLSIHQKRFSEIEGEDLKAQLELKSYDLSLFRSRAEQNEHLEFCELVKRIEQELLEAKSAANEKQLLYKGCITTVSLLEKSICENTNTQDVKLKDLEKKMGKAQVQSASKDLKKHAVEKERLLMEMEVVKQECASLESQLVSLKQRINSLTSEVDGLKTMIASVRNAHDQEQSELNLFCSKMKERDTQISCILREQQELQHKISKRNL